ncbi:TSR2 [Sanghuangporus sanghuang]
MASASFAISPAPAPDSSIVLFARGVIARLSVWEALRLAVDEGWGGPESAQKRTWMASEIVDAFENAKPSEIPDAIYIEEMLLQIMADEFDTILEDESAVAVARDIMSLWEMRDADERIKASVTVWEERMDRFKGRKVVSKEVVQESTEVDGSSDEWEDGDDTEDEEAPQLLDRHAQSHRAKPQVDDEGFTMVTKKGKGRR